MIKGTANLVSAPVNTKELKFRYTLPQNVPSDGLISIMGLNFVNGQIEGMTNPGVLKKSFSDLVINQSPVDVRSHDTALNFNDIQTGPLPLTTGIFPNSGYFNVTLTDTAEQMKTLLEFEQLTGAFNPAQHYCLVSSVISHAVVGRYYLEYSRNVSGSDVFTDMKVLILNSDGTVNMLSGSSWYANSSTGAVIDIQPDKIQWIPDYYQSSTPSQTHNFTGVIPKVFVGVMVAGKSSSGSSYVRIRLRPNFTQIVPNGTIPWLD